MSLADEHFQRPDDFDLACYWGESVASFESELAPVDVVVRGTPRGLDALRGLGSPTATGGGTFVVPFESLDDAYYEVLRTGAAVEVIEPESLRTRLAETGRSIVASGEPGARHDARDPCSALATSPPVADWQTISSLATAGGTLVLAVATFSAVACVEPLRTGRRGGVAHRHASAARSVAR